MPTLFLIPARAGSQGIVGKNCKLLGGKPLVQYSLELARVLSRDENICVSTNDNNVIKVLSDLKYSVPFIRPEALSTNTSGSYEVMIHALNYYKAQGRKYERLVFLQPTSPFRNVQHLNEAISLFTKETEMVVSVKETRSNPYYVLMEENKSGWLEKSKSSKYTRRQDVPPVYELNGAIYVIDVEALRQKPISSFTRIRKYVMNEISSIDLDTPIDWLLAETVLANGLLNAPNIHP